MVADGPNDDGAGNVNSEAFFKAPALRRRNGVQHQAVIPVRSYHMCRLRVKVKFPEKKHTTFIDKT